MNKLSELSTSWKIILKSVTGNVVISEVAAFMKGILNTTEKLLCYGELVGIIKCKML
jgi:hypothetical protein